MDDQKKQDEKGIAIGGVLGVIIGAVMFDGFGAIAGFALLGAFLGPALLGSLKG